MTGLIVPQELLCKMTKDRSDFYEPISLYEFAFNLDDLNLRKRVEIQADWWSLRNTFNELDNYKKEFDFFI